MADALTLKVEVTGGPDIGVAVMNALQQMPEEFIGPLVEEAEGILAVSREIVPVDQGILRDSAAVVGVTPSKESDGVYVRFGYGGAASSYAVMQHETPPEVFSHAEGKSWKYLERPVYEAAATMGDRLAGRIAARFAQKLVGGGGGTGGSGETFGGG